MSLRPFFQYFGGKWRSANAYPEPRHRTIIEPFAGSAGYSLRYPSRRVVLVEKSPPIAAIWRYLIRVSASELLALPDLPERGSVDDVEGLTQEQRWLIGMWVQSGVSGPRKTMTVWPGADYEGHHKMNKWGRHVRRRLAQQVGHIRHWTIIEGDYTEAARVAHNGESEATWFIDPPYQLMGKHYPCGSDAIDFAELGTWCRTRRGQVIVCEATGADWLPFRHLGSFKANQVNSSGVSSEAIWTNEEPAQRVLFA